MTADATIFALSTPKGRGAIAVVRVSGPSAELVLETLAGYVPAPRRAALASLKSNGELLDRALILWLPGPHSFTGEDMAELHVHGGQAVVSAVLEAIARIPDCRLAEPGEFTRRGFDHNRFDLVEAEAIGDLVEAETAAQRRQALDQMGGAFSALVTDWAERLKHALAHVEAAIDFADEDLPGDVAAPALAVAEELAADIHRHLADNRRGEITRDGLSVAIIGPPNSGKSSLLNALAKREAAIVSSIAGTTRDVIEIHLDLGGYAVTLADTAGLRESYDPIEREGIARARKQAEQAELRILVLDAAAPGMWEDFRELADERTILVWNKSDLAPAPPLEGVAASAILSLSAGTGTGLEALETAIEAAAATRLAGPPALVTRARHREALTDCVAALDRVFHVKQSGGDAALVAEDLRLALRALGRITGRVDVEDLLDVIFRDFCIGK